jgi:hypothetical protein
MRSHPIAVLWASNPAGVLESLAVLGFGDAPGGHDRHRRGFPAHESRRFGLFVLRNIPRRPRSATPRREGM